MSFRNVLNSALPPSPYSGPPLPDKLGVKWPNSLQQRLPNWAFKASMKTAIFRDKIVQPWKL